MSTATATHPAAAALEGASIDALLDAVIRLTHRIHAYDDCAEEARPGSVRAHWETKAADARAQRSLARAEIVRRATR